MKIEDVLSIVCTKLEITSTTDFQIVFAVADEKEARLGYDVLVAHGFECKFYAESNRSKLYVTKPKSSDASANSRLAAAAAYAHTLKRIKSELDGFGENSGQGHSPDYSLSFVNLPGSGGKQILISILPSNATPAASPSSSTAQPSIASAAASQKQVSAQPAGAPSIKTSKYMRRQQEETMFSGPSLISDNNKIITKKEKQKQEEDSAWRRFCLYIKGNSAVAASIIVVMLFVMLTLFSMVVVSKGFLCPDLAHNKKENRAWYCQEDEDDSKKPQAPTQ